MEDTGVVRWLGEEEAAAQEEEDGGEGFEPAVGF